MAMLIKCFWERVPPTLLAAHTPKTAWLGCRSSLYGPVDRYTAQESIFNLQLVAGDRRGGGEGIPNTAWFKGRIPDHFGKSTLNTQCSVSFNCLLIQGCPWLFQLHISPCIRCAPSAANANLKHDKRCKAVSDTFEPLELLCRSPGLTPPAPK